MSQDAKISITVDGAAVAQQAFNNVASAVEGTGQKLGGLSSGFGTINGLLSTFGVGLSVGALVGFGKALLDDADHLVKLHDKTAITLQDLQRLQIAGDDAGVSIDSVADAVNKLQKNLGGGNDSAAAALATLHLDLRDIRALTPENQFYEIAAALRDVKDPAQQVALAVALFGRGAAEVLPVIKRGFDDVRKAAVGMSDDTVRNLEAVGDASGAMWRTAKGVFANIAVNTLHPDLFGMRAGAAALDAAREAAEKMAPKIAMVAPHEVEINVKAIERALDAERKQLDAAQKSAIAFTSELTKNAEAAHKLEAGFAGLHATVGILDDKEKDLLEHLLESRAAIDVIERSAWRASFGLTGMAEGLDKIGEHNDDIVTLARSLQRMVDVERTIPAGFYQAGLALDSLGLKSTEIDELRIKLIGAKGATGEWSGALTTLANDFTQMAQIGGDSFSPFLRGAGEGIKAIEMLSGSMKQFGAMSAGANGGFSAANIAGFAASTATAVLSMYALMESIGAAVGSARKLAAIEQFGKAVAAQLGTTTRLSKGLETQLQELHDTVMTLNTTDLDTLTRSFLGLDKAAALTADDQIRILNAWNTLSGLIPEAIKMPEIIRELGGASALTAKQIGSVKDSVKLLTDTMKLGGAIGQQAFASLQALFGEFVPSLDDITDAAGRYGLKLDDLGPKVKQLSIDKQAAQIVKDFQLLVGAGVPLETLMRDIITRTTDTGASFDQMSKDAQAAYLAAGGVVTSTTTGMHKQIQDVVADALRLGGTLPETMKPIIEKLIASGDLVDDNGDKLADLSKFNFAKPLEQMVDALIKKLDELISKFNDVGTAAGGIYGSASGGGPAFGGAQASGGDYLVTRPTLFLAGDNGPERATFRPQGGLGSSGGGGGTTTIITKTYLDGRQIAEALTKV